MTPELLLERQMLHAAWGDASDRVDALERLADLAGTPAEFERIVTTDVIAMGLVRKALLLVIAQCGFNHRVAAFKRTCREAVRNTPNGEPTPALDRLRSVIENDASTNIERLRAYMAAEIELSRRQARIVQTIATSTIADMREIRRVSEHVHDDAETLEELRARIGRRPRNEKYVTAPNEM